ncbi:MAG: hypothetical protein WAM00_01230 [Salegentibacter sp.]
MRATLKIFLILSLFTGSLFAQETHVVVRAKANDAKFIGSSIGGAKIIVRDAVTGEILDQGMTSGSTGNTEKLMKQPHERGVALSEENTAGFVATLDIQEPVFVTVEAIAPFNKKQARVLSSTQLWVIPGKDITGDGVLLQIPGFVVDILSPQTHEALSADHKVEIKANVVMMCGCPVTDGGLWDAKQYEVKAVISRDGEKVKEIPLQIGEKSSTFSAETELEKGLYEVLVYAYDPVSSNTGVDKTNIIVN